MLYQVLVAIGLIAFFFNLVFNLKSLKTPIETNKTPKDMPRVSILVPARNEEANIKACLESLQKQDYPDFEILVLDDSSEDMTADIVSRMAAGDARIRLINGQPLPHGWSGKPFACYQLAKNATGSWLLFVDADTTHAPSMLKNVMAVAAGSGISMLSGFPRQLANSLPQKIVIPVLYFFIMSWLPLWWLQRSGKPRPSLAIGQFLLFPTEEYWRIGGHAAVKNKIIEDVWLGIEVHRHKGRQMVVDLSDVVSCNMYRSVRVMWQGFIRWIYSVAAISPVGVVVLLLAAYVFYLAPFYWIWGGMAGSKSFLWWDVIIFQAAIILFMRRLVDSRFKEPWISAWLHPIGFCFLFASAFYAGWRKIFGGGISWKERIYNGKSTLE